MNDLSRINIESIMDSLSEGVYVCDLDRRITYWSKSAERITGWRAEEVVGQRCFDDVLCHIDKDGHHLCGEEYCPLHRAMVTGAGSKGSLLVYARGKDGRRIPMQVSVAPIYNADKEVIGGVETFSDAWSMVHDLERAKAIQQIALRDEPIEDSCVSFTTHYVPHGIVGGDYYAYKTLDEGRFGLMLADVMGHGIAAALYTMHLSSLWDRHCGLLPTPVQFAGAVNNELVQIVREDESFATAICGSIDIERREFRFTSAGGPPVLLMHADGEHEFLESSGLPFAVMEDAPYEETVATIRAGDRLLLFSDGALEITNNAGAMLEADGLLDILRSQGYPGTDIQMDALEEELLRYSNAIRLEDDLTLVEARIHE
jgi:PAS domain S-box-containing protein